MKGNFQNRLIKSLLVLAMVFGFISLSHVTTYAATATTDTTATVGAYTINVPVGAEIPDTNSSTTVTKITSESTTLSGGWYVVDENVTIGTQLNLTGDVNIIIKDGCTLTVSSVIEGYSFNLTIWGEDTSVTAGGTLSATDPDYALDVKSLTVNKGTVSATGTGVYGYGMEIFGNLLVNGGSVIAKGNGVGIFFDSDGNITVNNGTLEAIGTADGACAICGRFDESGTNISQVFVNNSEKILVGPSAEGSETLEGNDYSELFGDYVEGDNHKWYYTGYKYVKITSNRPKANTNNNTTATDTTASTAYVPAIVAANVNGMQLDSWTAIDSAIEKITAADLAPVADADGSMMKIDICGSANKTIPKNTVEALSAGKNFTYLHLMIGEADAITFCSNSDISGYKETDFTHTDTVTGDQRLIDFSVKQDIGTTVLLHTTVPKTYTLYAVYFISDSGEYNIHTAAVSTKNGQICFPISETGKYLLKPFK